jgi:hypothetical protein
MDKTRECEGRPGGMPRLIRNFVVPDAELLFVRVDQAQIEINSCADSEFDQG